MNYKKEVKKSINEFEQKFNVSGFSEGIYKSFAKFMYDKGVKSNLHVVTGSANKEIDETPTECTEYEKYKQSIITIKPETKQSGFNYSTGEWEQF